MKRHDRLLRQTIVEVKAELSLPWSHSTHVGFVLHNGLNISCVMSISENIYIY